MSKQKLCTKTDNCQKIDMIKDKDMLDFQFVESVKAVCDKCDDFITGGQKDKCPKCKGLGGLRGIRWDELVTQKCPICNGTGEKILDRLDREGNNGSDN